MTHVLLAIIYVAFISLGLPDALLGAAWPSMYRDFSVPVSYSGIIFMIIAGGTIVSSLQSDRLTKRLGAGAVTAISVLTTALALFGFSISHSYIALCLWAIPYGLGAGSVDAALNNYVAIHYASRHMSWLHCMWGVGASLGPYIMGYALTGGLSWNSGYRYIAVLQIGLTAVLFFSLPLWRGQTKIARKTGAADTKAAPLPLRHVVSIPGAKEIMITFFCYCAGRFTAHRIRMRPGVSFDYPCDACKLWKRQVTGNDRGSDGFRLCWNLSYAAGIRTCRKSSGHITAAVLFAGYLDSNGIYARKDVL